MSDTFSITRLSRGDVGELLPVFRQYQAFYEVCGVDELQARAYLSEILAATDAFVLGARNQGDVVGFATGFITYSGYFAQRIVHMGDVFVIPTNRRLGIGQTLIRAVASHALTLGITRVRWLTSRSNDGAQRLYEGVGASKSDVRQYILRTDPKAG